MTTDNAAVTNMLAPGSAPTVPTGPSPALAAEKLQQLTSDSSWGAKFRDGDSAARAQFNELTAQIAQGDAVGDALAGRSPPSEPFAVQTIIGDELPPRAMQSAVADLQLKGLTDAAIVEIMSGKSFSPAEVAAAEGVRERIFRDAAARALYLKGDRELGKTVLICNCIIAAGVTT
jgi:hypothetical protein